jgi:hypothetical protein
MKNSPRHISRMLKCLMISSSLLVFGCTNINVNLKESSLSENVKNKALNHVSVSYKEKDLFNVRANSHKDPNLKGDLIRQEYFINLKF